ncbi:unnamed protein product [Discosporangium mesarthrocarpum]
MMTRAGTTHGWMRHMRTLTTRRLAMAYRMSSLPPHHKRSGPQHRFARREVHLVGRAHWTSKGRPRLPMSREDGPHLLELRLGSLTGCCLLPYQLGAPNFAAGRTPHSCPMR